MEIMGKMVRIPAGNITNLHYNFVVAKPLVIIKELSAFAIKLELKKIILFKPIFGLNLVFHIKARLTLDLTKQIKAIFFILKYKE